MSSPVQISDDDESFDQKDLDEIKEVSDINETVELSSDDTEEYYTSDEDLPKVQVKRTEVIKQLFPTKPKPISSRTNPGKPKPSCSSASNESWMPSRQVPTCSASTSSVTSLPRVVKMIGGVKVVLPVEPYGCQTALMFKIITAINKCQNCLLESPTGSGKTLALLCGALAWLMQERNRVSTLQAQQFVGLHPELSSVDGAVDVISQPEPVDLGNLFSRTGFGGRSIYDKPINGSSSNPKRQEPMDQDVASPSTSEVTIHKKRKLNSTPEKWKPGSNCATPEKPIQIERPGTPEEIKVPTIYYGARTHKQLQQVIKEFSRTAYAGDVTMTILSSREYSCIREFDRDLWPSKNDMCRGCVKKELSANEMTDAQRRKSETNCKYYNNREHLDHGVMPPAFDLEDLVNAGHEKMACPYYAAREMAKTAGIVFCPYNYLIEPGIRNSMGINLENNIVIIDEAHNIEDICRDAASLVIKWDNVKTSIQELETCTNYRFANSEGLKYFDHLLVTLKNWDQWFNNQQPLVNSKPVNNNEAVHTWEVEHFTTTLNNHNIGEKQYKDFKEAADVFCRRLRESPHMLYGVTQITGTLVESLDIVLGYMFREGGRFKDDFKPALVRNVSGGEGNDPHRWRSSQFNKRIDKESLSLRLICLNPAVVFGELQSARCIILASGTLTPLLSLHSELAAPFPLQISPSHVISPDRVWIGSVSTCPDGSRLECTSRGAELGAVQDAVGQCVLYVSQVTPHGVLVFLPSYALMAKLLKRWEETGLWRKLNNLKHVFAEARNSRDHNDIMEDYYKYVSSEKGAVLFAVYRGKVSEGMDFKDHQARAVITVGVPYPNTFDMAVQEKMKYNDKYKNRGLLPSREWLRVQAYRALNQAAGRCVRHRADWGAVLLLDARFTHHYYTEHLSKWLRTFLGNNHHTFESLVNSTDSIESFMQKMRIEDENENYK